jgi:4-hydroxybenzoate polyprenyltransferase
MAQGALTYLLLEAPINPIVIALLGCSTLCLYNFSLLLSKPTDFKVSPYKRVQWFFSHYPFIIGISSIASLAVLMLAIKLSLSSLLLLISISILAISYNAPILKIGSRRFGLRSIPGAKLFIIAGVWACSCVWLPIMELKTEGFMVSGTDALLLISKRFLFILAITLPFDIRDLYQDRIFGLKTIPVLIGETNALRLCQALLFVYLLLLYIFVENINTGILALTMTVFLTSFLIFNTKIKKSEYYYFFLLDGTLLLQFVTVWMADKLS